MLGHYKDCAIPDARRLTDVERNVERSCDLLQDVWESVGDDNSDVNIPCILFCIEQLRIAIVPACRRRFSSDLLRFAFLLHMRSSACFYILYKIGKVILPHPSTIFSVQCQPWIGCR